MAKTQQQLDWRDDVRHDFINTGLLWRQVTPHTLITWHYLLKATFHSLIRKQCWCVWGNIDLNDLQLAKYGGKIQLRGKLPLKCSAQCSSLCRSVCMCSDGCNASAVWQDQILSSILLCGSGVIQNVSPSISLSVILILSLSQCICVSPPLFPSLL